MEVKCLGEVIIEPASLAELIMALRGVADEEGKDKLTSAMTYFRLGEKQYVPLTDDGKIDHSENRCKTSLERSRGKPQPVGEVAEFRHFRADLSIKSSMVNRLWLYDGKIYQSNRNDYNQEQVHLLILDFLDREKKRFKDLEQKFKKSLGS